MLKFGAEIIPQKLPNDLATGAPQHTRFARRIATCLYPALGLTMWSCFSAKALRLICDLGCLDHSISAPLIHLQTTLYFQTVELAEVFIAMSYQISFGSKFSFVWKVSTPLIFVFFASQLCNANATWLAILLIIVCVFLVFYRCGHAHLSVWQRTLKIRLMIPLEPLVENVETWTELTQILNVPIWKKNIPSQQSE